MANFLLEQMRNYLIIFLFLNKTKYKNKFKRKKTEKYHPKPKDFFLIVYLNLLYLI